MACSGVMSGSVHKNLTSVTNNIIYLIEQLELLIRCFSVIVFIINYTQFKISKSVLITIHFNLY